MSKTLLFDFVWDDYKARSNKQKHGVSFDHASEVLLDPLALTMFDTDNSDNEDRWLTIGRTRKGRTLILVHTYQHINAYTVQVRVISARETTREERYYYENEPR